MSNNRNTLLEVENLKTHFFTDEGIVKAVDGVSFDLKRGEVLGVIGESGCGKSVTAFSILQLVPPPGRIVEGSILFHNGEAGTDLAALDPRGDRIRAIRTGQIGLIFQEPMSSFSPVHTVGNQIDEAIMLHLGLNKKEARERTVELLNSVGMPNPRERYHEYPHELSGGMRQRAMIAMALSCEPVLLIADEPTTALDVTIEAQILELLQEKQEEENKAMIMITHDLAVIAEMADKVAVMYLGIIVESADIFTLFEEPSHPYTRALFESIPSVEERSGTRLSAIRGTVPNPLSVPEGCPFSNRCEKTMGICSTRKPPVEEIEDGHFVRCFLYEGGEGSGEG